VRQDRGLDAFISYSHRDAEFVHQLANALEHAGLVVWIDADDIPAGAPWRDELGSGIEAADAFVFVLSPDSTVSEECAKELARALDLGKRLVPVLLRAVDRIPAGLDAVQYVDATARDVASTARLTAEAITVDRDWLRQHTQWLARALRWDDRGRSKGYLLRGSELDAAEAWLARQREGHVPPPTALHTDYVGASRAAEKHRLRVLLGAAIAAVLVSSTFAVIAFLQRGEDIEQRSGAESRALAAASVSQLAVDPELSVLLGLEAMEEADTPEARDAIRRALVESHVRTAWEVSDGVSDLAVAPDGDVVAVGAHDGTLVLADAATGADRWAVQAAGTPIRRVLFDASGSRLLTSSDEGIVQLWDAVSGDSLAAVPGTSGAFSPDGERIVTAGDDGSARLFSAADGRALAELSGEAPMTGASFSPDGESIVTIERNEEIVRVWDVAAARATEIGSFDLLVSEAMFVGDSRVVVRAAFDTTVWDVPAGRLVAQLGMSFVVVPSPDGDRVLTASVDGTSSVWTTDGEEVAVLRTPHGGFVRDAAWSADGSRVMTAAADRLAQVWDAATGDVLAPLRAHTGSANAVSFGPDGHTVLTGDGTGIVRVWDLPDAVVLRGHGAWDAPLDERAADLRSVDFSADGEQAVTTATDGTARLWDVRTGAEVLDLPGCERASEPFSCLSGAVMLDHASFIIDGEIRPDGEAVLTVGSDGTVQVHALDGTRLGRFGQGTADGLAAASFDPSGARVVAAGTDGMAQIWEVETGAQLATMRVGAPVTDARFTPDGQFVLTSDEDDELELWRADDGAHVRTVAEDAGEVGGIDLTADGRFVVAPVDEGARVYDVDSGAEVVTLLGHTGLVTSASFSPDGRFVVTSGFDRTARIWDARTGSELAVLRGHEDVLWAATFSPDGRHVATAAEDATARIWVCEACTSDDELGRAGRSAVTRELTPAERSRYLGG
jgi:WD40 repeat protein